MGGFVGGSGKSGLLASISSFIKPFIGAGMLSTFIIGMPSVWASGGIVAANVMLFSLAVVAGWCIFQLVACCDMIMLCEARKKMHERLYRAKHNISLSESVPVDLFEVNSEVTDDDLIEADWADLALPTFTDVGMHAFGVWGGKAVDYSIICTQLGGCIAYVIFIAQNMSNTLGLEEWQWVLIMYVPLLVLALVRRIELLAPTTMMGNFVYLFTIGVIFYQGFRSYCCIPSSELVYSDITYYPLIFGTCSFALEGIALVLPVKSRMEDQKRFPFAITVAVIIVTTIYLVFGTMGYLFFGNDAESPIILSLPKEPLTDVVMISQSISLYFTFGIQAFPAATFFDEVVDKYMHIDLPALAAEKQAEAAEVAMKKAKDIAKDKNIDVATVNVSIEPVDVSPEALIPQQVKRRNMWQVVHRMLFVAFCCAVAIGFPNFKLIVALFGSFSNSLLAYIFPALFWIRICASEKLYGIYYYPYDKHGLPTVHPLERSLDDDVNSLNSIAQDENTVLVNKCSKVTLQKKLFVIGIPFLVAVIGSIASVIGVVDAIKDIIKHFT